MEKISKKSALRTSVPKRTKELRNYTHFETRNRRRPRVKNEMPRTARTRIISAAGKRMNADDKKINNYA